ncbi:MAG: hypothetical protein HY852_01665 [Bradyrhizobium sp.]|uniref:hypothetical protein n=1 Tax=Bradyrhizobium sp. TaxID=376 RepID=UPI0025B867A4|nr:hypothetical protein [Bradyrhizobium sp.]MBI5260506.1 hypothetical protein [Bradyrhizobium sp.]
MSDFDRPEQAESVGGSLVPVTPTVQWVHKNTLPRPDPTFVTQLIANAEEVPQARRLRRATPADAKTAYAARREPARTGFKTRQLI